MNKSLLSSASLGLAATMLLSGCQTSGESAIAGALAGAAISAATGHEGRDIAHGAAIGAGAGYLLGKAVQRERRYQDDEVYAGTVHRRVSYPVAEPTNRRGFVTSPYAPYNLIDVRGIPHGAQVIDPSADRVFINP